MEFSGVFSSEEWDSFSKLFFTEDYSDSTMQYSIPNESLSFCPSVDANACTTGIDETLFYSSDNLNSNLFHFSQESSGSSHGSSVFLPNITHDSYLLNDPNYTSLTNNDNIYEAIEFYVLDEENIDDAHMREVTSLSGEVQLDAGNSSESHVIVAGTESQLKRKYNMPGPEPNANDKTSGMIHENPKKRIRVTRNKVNKNVQTKNKEKVTPNGDAEEEINNCCTTSSEDDSNASQEINEVSAALNLNGKTRTNRGSATDPQSLYARKRREKINERLKILQHLVPNGTKVDISTMLEEAVDYVKFLQVQIKLLSSDDHWMYAPIAYNGMDIGFLRNIAPAL